MRRSAAKYALGEAFLKEVAFVFAGETVEGAEEGVALVLVEGEGLEIKGIEVGRVTAAHRGLAFGGGEKLCAPALAAHVVGERETFDVEPIAAGVAAQSADDFAVV